MGKPKDPSNNNPSTTKKKYVRLRNVRYTLEEKLKAVREFDGDPKKVDEICQKYNITQKVLLAKWKEQEASLEAALKQRKGGTYVKKHVSKVDEINEELYRWFRKNAKAGVRFTGSVIRQRAIEINRRIQGKKEFNASFNWFLRWRSKYNIGPDYVYRGGSSDNNANSSDEEVMAILPAAAEPIPVARAELPKRNGINDLKKLEERAKAPVQLKERQQANHVQVQLPSDYDHEAIDCIQKVIDYFKGNLVASHIELDVLIKLRLKAEEYERNKNREKQKSPEFFSCE